MSQSPIGERVRALRKLHGLTQEQLARKADLSLLTVARTEADYRTRRGPRVDTLVKLARVLGVSVSELVRDVDDIEGDDDSDDSDEDPAVTA
jgi:transcriptional regulator with XRE-family HTH domain